ncbi:MAG: hypothetical protein R6V07_11510 [Armatimonadota bacterium]
MKRHNILCLIGFVIAVLLVAAVPAAREGFESVLVVRGLEHQNIDSPRVIRQIAAESPGNRDMALGYAMKLERLQDYAYVSDLMQERPRGYHPDLWGAEITEADVENAFEDAFERWPDDPAPRFLWAEHLIGQLYMAFDLPMFIEFVPELPNEPRTVEQEHVEDVREIRGLLEDCGRLAPENSAVDYLIAWTWLVEDDREQALAALRRATEKTEFTRYHERGTEAAVALCRRSGDPTPHAAVNADNMSLSFSLKHGYLYDASHALAAYARALPEEGRDEEAMDIAKMILIWGRRLRENAWWSLENSAASIVSRDARAALAGWKGPRKRKEESFEDFYYRQTMVGAEAASEYARQHGRPELAEAIMSEAMASYRTKMQMRRSLPCRERLMHYPTTWAAWPEAMATWITTFWLACVGIPLLLAFVVLRWWRSGGHKPKRNWPASVVLLTLLIVPGWVVARWMASRADIPALVGLPHLNFSSLMAVGVVAWVIGVVVLTVVRVRGGTMPELSRTRAFLKSVEYELDLALAVLLVASALGVWWMGAKLHEVAETQYAILEVGDAEFYRITASDDEFEARMAELCGEDWRELEKEDGEADG